MILPMGRRCRAEDKAGQPTEPGGRQGRAADRAGQQMTEPGGR